MRLFERPLYVGWDIHLGSDKVGSERINFYGGAWGVVIVFGGERSTFKITARRSCGNNKESIGSRSFAAVGKRAIYLKVFTRAFRYKCGRAASVTVCGVDAAHLYHVFAHFVHIEASGIRRLTSIGYGENDFTICGNTYECTGFMTAGVILAIRRLGNSVGVGLYKPFPDRDCILFPTGQRVGLRTHENLGHIVRTLFTADGMIIIIYYNNGILS